MIWWHLGEELISYCDLGRWILILRHFIALHNSNSLREWVSLIYTTTKLLLKKQAKKISYLGLHRDFKKVLKKQTDKLTPPPILENFTSFFSGDQNRNTKLLSKHFLPFFQFCNHVIISTYVARWDLKPKCLKVFEYLKKKYYYFVIKFKIVNK